MLLVFYVIFVRFGVFFFFMLVLGFLIKYCVLIVWKGLMSRMIFYICRVVMSICIDYCYVFCFYLCFWYFDWDIVLCVVVLGGWGVIVVCLFCGENYFVVDCYVVS